MVRSLSSTMVAALAALTCSVAWIAPAAAQEAPARETAAQAVQNPHDVRGVLRLGKLYTFGGGTDLQHGFGMDLRYELYPDGAEDGYLGVFSQGQYELGDAWRFAGGVALGWGVFGLEVGVSHRTETSNYAGSTGLHLAQSFTFGPVSVGARLTVPLVDWIPVNTVAPMQVQGIEGALVIRLGFGFPIHGPRQSGQSGHHGCHAHGGQRRNPHGHHGH
ncbi:MAG: hypothetical protein AB7S26_24195 [Sandaracinaceae bacterium]